MQCPNLLLQRVFYIHKKNKISRGKLKTLNLMEMKAVDNQHNTSATALMQNINVNTCTEKATFVKYGRCRNNEYTLVDSNDYNCKMPQ